MPLYCFCIHICFCVDVYYLGIFSGLVYVFGLKLAFSFCFEMKGGILGDRVRLWIFFFFFSRGGSV
jgi:hypothetical protein